VIITKREAPAEAPAIKATSHLLARRKYKSQIMAGNKQVVSGQNHSLANKIRIPTGIPVSAVRKNEGHKKTEATSGWLFWRMRLCSSLLLYLIPMADIEV
jgi:hypothetical protein